MTENEKSKGATKASTGTGNVSRPCQLIDSKTFAERKYPLTWLVKSILVDQQPGVIGGSEKSLKTTFAVDLAISVATGTKFLGRFAVPRPRPVAVFSGESGQAVLKATSEAICRAKGTCLSDIDVHWGFDLPRLSSEEDLAALTASLKKTKAGLVIFDPLYLCLFAGGRASDASNLYCVGPILRAAAQACLAVGATPVVIHHTSRGATKAKTKKAETVDDGELALDLSDLAYSGVSEFARQWILVRHREPCEIGTGRHSLLMSVGGSAGHSGLWRVEVDEGVLDENLKGRRWKVSVAPAGQDTGAGPRPNKSGRPDNSLSSSLKNAFGTKPR